MIVPSLNFLLFGLGAAVLFNLSTAVRWRQAILCVANLVFLASFSRNLAAFIPLAAFLLLGASVMQLTRGVRAPRLFIGLLALTIFAFLWLKRYSFIPNAVLIPFPYVVVGLSYIFFRVLHVIIDYHQGSIEHRVPAISFLNYTLNFTSLTAGPIQRYEDYRRMELALLPLDFPVIGRAIERIVLGYFKVAVVSMLLASTQHQAIDALGSALSASERLYNGILIAAIYPIYLYFNFSGYVDVVIGVARLLRIELPENFDRPFSSQNFISFWSRWHITLSNWLKTYVFNPLMMAGMTRISSAKYSPYLSVAAFFVTFFLVGLWHGQTSEFLFFGFLQGGGVAANKLYQLVMQNALGRKRYRDLAANGFYQACSRGLTFTWFAFTLFWFWSNWQQIAQLYRSVGATETAAAWFGIFAGATVILALMESARAAVLNIKRDDIPIVRSRYVRASWTTALTVITIAVIVLLDSPAPDIVYKTF